MSRQEREVLEHAVHTIAEQAANADDLVKEAAVAGGGDHPVTVHAKMLRLELLKVKADLESRSHVLETVQLFRAKVVDVAPDAVTIEATGSPDKLDALLRVLEPFGIRELVQSGVVAVGRGSRSITDRTLRPLDRTA